MTPNGPQAKDAGKTVDNSSKDTKSDKAFNDPMTSKQCLESCIETVLSSTADVVLNSAYEILDPLYPSEIRFLDERNPFQFLVSVILSAQTTDESVNKVAPRLFAEYPDAKALSSANIEDVKSIIRITGFFNMKAKHIIDCAKALCERHGGQVPSSMEDLLALPGVGRKTANCVRANVMGFPGIVVDTHFSRVVARLLGLKDRDPVKIESIVAKSLPQKRWSRFSMVANSHGRDVCHASRPSCSACSICHLCMGAGFCSTDRLGVQPAERAIGKRSGFQMGGEQENE